MPLKALLEWALDISTGNVKKQFNQVETAKCLSIPIYILN